MLVYAHRGASGYAPENTLDAFKLAIEMQVDGIETDVHLTKDNIAVLIHDETIDRTCNGKGFIKDYTYQELCSFYANNKMDGFEARIPTLEQLLQLIQGTNLELQLEIKTDHIFYPGIEQIVYDLIKEYQLEKQVYYSSFNHYSMMKMKEIDSNNKIAFLYDGILHEAYRYVSSYPTYAIHPQFCNLQIDNYVTDCHYHHLKVNVWTVNEKMMMKQMMELGVDGIFTNYPDIALKLRHE